MSLYICCGKFLKGYLQQVFHFDITDMEMINMEQNVLQIKLEFWGEGISCYLNVSLSLRQGKKNKFTAFAPYSQWNFYRKDRCYCNHSLGFKGKYYPGGASLILNWNETLITCILVCKIYEEGWVLRSQVLVPSAVLGQFSTCYV